jgi:hypothetical protein
MIKKSDVQNPDYTINVTINIRKSSNGGLIVNKAISMYDQTTNKPITNTNEMLAYSKDNLLDLNTDLGLNIIEDI